MISAIVLAAGRSTRFGRTKQLEQVRGKALVQHAIDASAEAGLSEIVLVLGHDADAVREAVALPPGGRVVVNPAFGSGMASSLAAGLASLDEACRGAVILMGDQPGVTSAHVRALVAGFAARPSPIVRLRFDSGPGPSLLARSVWAEAIRLEGDAGARQLMERDPSRVTEVEAAGDAPVDVDRPEDLDRA